MVVGNILECILQQSRPGVDQVASIWEEDGCVLAGRMVRVGQNKLVSTLVSRRGRGFLG